MSAASPVYARSTLAARPVFHIGGESELTVTPLLDGWARRSWRHKALCGQVVYRNEWASKRGEETRNYRVTENYTAIRRDHAMKIGRLCARCEKAENLPVPDQALGGESSEGEATGGGGIATPQGPECTTCGERPGAFTCWCASELSCPNLAEQPNALCDECDEFGHAKLPPLEDCPTCEGTGGNR